MNMEKRKTKERPLRRGNMFSKLGEKAAAAAAEAAVKAQAAAASAAEKTQAGLASAKQAAVEAKASATEDLDEITGVLRILTEATGQLGLSTIPFHDLTLGMKYHKQDIVAAFSSAGWDHGGGPKSSSRPELLHLLGMAHLAGSAYEHGPDGINKYLQGSDPAPLKKASDKNLLFTVACEDMQLAGVKISAVIGSLEPYDAKRAFMPAWYVAKDDVMKIVYLVVRGTASTKDALTDLNMKPDTWQGLTMHSGIWKCAQNVIAGANQACTPSSLLLVCSSCLRLQLTLYLCSTTCPWSLLGTNLSSLDTLLGLVQPRSLRCSCAAARDARPLRKRQQSALPAPVFAAPTQACPPTSHPSCLTTTWCREPPPSLLSSFSMTLRSANGESAPLPMSPVRSGRVSQ